MCRVVEKRIPHKNITVDCFGGDILAVHTQLRKTALIQATSSGNVSARVEKCTSVFWENKENETSKQVLAWVTAGNKFFVHGWNGSKLKVVELTF